MRVMFYHTAREWSGSARVFVSASQGLSARGYHSVFVCTRGSAVEARAQAAGCDVIALDGTGSLLAQSWRLRRILNRRFVEAVFLHTPAEHLAVAGAVRLAGRGGIVRRVPAGAHPAMGTRTRMALRLASSWFVCAGHSDAEALARRTRFRTPIIAELGVDPERYDDLHAVPAPALGAGPGARLVVCVSERGQRSRVATALRAMALLAPRHPELHLAILGPRAGREDVRIHAAALGITRQVSYLGERDDDLAVLRSAAVGWVVAGSDTGAYAALDFMAMRIPVLADRDTIGARYIADGQTGVLLAPGDVATAAAVLAEWLANTGQRRVIGGAGRARVTRHYQESGMVSQLQQAADLARDRSQWAV